MAHLAHLTDGEFHNGGSSAVSLAGIIGAGMRMDWWRGEIGTLEMAWNQGMSRVEID